MKPTPRTSYLKASITAVLTLSATGNVAAGPYDNTTTAPGTQIVNRATSDYTVQGINQLQIIAEATVVVQPFPTAGTLRGMRYNPNGQDTQNLIFARSEFASNVSGGSGFTPSNQPRDTSRVATGDGFIPAPGQLPVSEVDRVYPGMPIFYVLDDLGLNYDSTAIDTVDVTLTDAVTGDVELVRFYETGPDTGSFTAWVNTSAAGVSSGDGAIQTRPLSRIEAVYTDPFAVERRLFDDIIVGPVDPFGIVFDSTTGAPIDGIAITIIDVSTGQPARVYGNDLSSVYPSTVVTGSTVTDSAGETYVLSRGEYRFPFVDIGTYRLEITEPGSHTFPTEVDFATLQGLPGGPFILDDGSRLEPFDVVPGPPIQIDLPADRRELVDVKRFGSADEAEVGEFVEYTVEITATETGLIDIRDTLPAGIDIKDETLRIDGMPVDVFLAENGRSFLIDDFLVTAGRMITVTYVAQAGLSAQPGSVLTTRTDVTSERLLSAFDVHDLDIKAPFDLDEMAIVGDVTVGACDAEPEIMNLSGIRIFLETGDYAITDADGRFSFRDISYRDHVVQIDELTLPLGGRAVLCEDNVRNAGSATSQFIDVAPGMLGRAEFRIVFDDPVLQENAELQRGLPSLSEVTGHPASNGVVKVRVDDGFIPAAARIPDFDQAWLDLQPATTPQGVLSPRDGHLPERSSIQIRVLRKDAHRVSLRLNGELVPSVHREKSLSSATSNLNVDRWIGVGIKEGRNLLVVEITAPDGTVVRDEREVLYATSFDKVEIVAESSRLETDGRSTPLVKVRMTGKDGIPLRPGTKVTASVNSPFTFEPEGGRRRSMDGTEKAPSGTTSITVGQDGIASMVLSPVLYPDTAVLTFPRRSGEEPAIVEAYISAAERPWVLVGIAEGSYAEGQIARHMRRPGDFGDSDGNLRGRLAFFAEGIIKGEWLMTLRYDSAAGESDEFFGIDPDKDYIVYGDRSTQGNAAESRFPFYLRLKRKDAELLIGDFQARINTRLLDVDRKVTGMRVEYEGENFRVLAFGAEVDQRFIVDRIALDGTSGPFRLTSGGIVKNSETVRILTVSRNDATEELNEEVLVAGVDYVMDQKSGKIFLRRPVPAFTQDFDRNILVVEYESDEDVDKGMLLGARAEADLTDSITIGASLLRAEKINGYGVDTNILQADITYQATENLTLSAEAMQVEKSSATGRSRGSAGEVRLTYEVEDTQFEAYVKTRRGATGLDAELTGDDVDITAATLSHRISTDVSQDGDVTEDGVYIEGEVSYERNHTTDERHHRGSVLLTRRSHGLTYGAGIEYNTFEGPDRIGRAINGLVKLGWISADGKTELEASLSKNINVEGEGVLTDALLIEANHEVNDTLSVFASFGVANEAGLGDHSTAASLGFTLAPWEGGEVTAGIVRAQAKGQSGSAAFVGARQQFTVSEGTILSFGMDAQRDIGSGELPLGATVGNPFIKEAFTSASVGLRKTTDRWSAGAELSYSVSEESKGGSFRVSADGELSDTWSIGGEALWGFSDENGVEDKDLRLRFGAAHRGEDRAPITILQLETDFDEGGDRKVYGSVNHHRYLNDASSLNLRAAAKWQRQTFTGFEVTDTTTFLGAEYRHDLSDKFDIGVHGSVMNSWGNKQMASSYGLSLGVTPFKNGRINVGYNFAGFRDPDYSSSGYTDKGAYIEFKVKFDQNTFREIFR
jgi:hypothetical protein